MVKVDSDNIVLGDLVINNTLYPRKDITKLVLKFCQKFYKFDAKYIVMYDRKNIWTFASIVASIITKKTFVLIPENMDVVNQENVVNDLRIDKIYDENDLKQLLTGIPESVDLNLKNVWDKSADDFIAYILYTSGTTGVPKGVEMPFSAVYNTFQSLREMYRINESDVIGNLAKWSFDLSIFDFLCSIFIGAKLVCIEDSKNIQNIHNAITTHKVTLWNSTPQVLGMYMRYLDIFKKKDINNVRLVFVSGDKFERQICNLVRQYFDKAKIISMGGATECAIWSVYYDCSEGFSEAIAPYGYALPNQNVEIIYDIDGVGEIVISGKGLAKGYFNNAKKTNEQFKMNKGERKYFTGDVGYIDEKGCIFIEGRKDSQVKIKGKRYKLDEIASMFFVEGFRNPVSVTDKQHTKVAVFIEKNSMDRVTIANIIEKSLLKDILNIRDVIELSDFPITQNGKIDKLSLQETWYEQ
ncbi:D-alanine-activating enzyme [Streptococcus infantarius subsp. infantarius]|nr:D-alanine-activating enzyme [Streptococcus infantarius subsp. infantarius]